MLVFEILNRDDSTQFSLFPSFPHCIREQKAQALTSENNYQYEFGCGITI